MGIRAFWLYVFVFAHPDFWPVYGLSDFVASMVSFFNNWIVSMVFRVGCQISLDSDANSKIAKFSLRFATIIDCLGKFWTRSGG